MGYVSQIGSLHLARLQSVGRQPIYARKHGWEFIMRWQNCGCSMERNMNEKDAEREDVNRKRENVKRRDGI